MLFENLCSYCHWYLFPYWCQKKKCRTAGSSKYWKEEIMKVKKMKRKGVRDGDSDKNVSVHIWAKAVHRVRNHSLPIKCLSFSPLDPLFTLFYSPICTGRLNCLDPMLYSFHLHFTNREPQKEMKKRRGGKLGYFSFVAFCGGSLSLAVSLCQRSDSR